MGVAEKEYTGIERVRVRREKANVDTSRVVKILKDVYRFLELKGALDINAIVAGVNSLREAYKDPQAQLLVIVSRGSYYCREWLDVVYEYHAIVKGKDKIVRKPRKYKIRED